jgi:hypothetical protein
MLVLFCDRVESISRVAGENIIRLQVSIKQAEDCGGSISRMGRMQWADTIAAKMPQAAVF